jgi:hypothetical protein
MNMSVLSGYVSGSTLVVGLETDPRFMGYSQSDALERFDHERMGIPLCITRYPDLGVRFKLRREDREMGEGQLFLPGYDLEPELVSEDPDHVCKDRACSHGMKPSDVCPFCKHPALKEGEVCLSRAVEVETYERMKIKSKRQAIALSDDGTALSDKYCAVIISESDMEELALTAALDPNYKDYFTR